MKGVRKLTRNKRSSKLSKKIKYIKGGRKLIRNKRSSKLSKKIKYIKGGYPLELELEPELEEDTAEAVPPSIKLPEGWSYDYDSDSDNEIYYINNITGDVTYDYPKKPAPGWRLPKGWTEKETADGRKFYINKYDELTFDFPRVPASIPYAEKGRAWRRDTGWKTLHDSLGNMYYYNEITNEITDLLAHPSDIQRDPVYRGAHVGDPKKDPTLKSINSATVLQTLIRGKLARDEAQALAEEQAQAKAQALAEEQAQAETQAPAKTRNKANREGCSSLFTCSRRQDGGFYNKLINNTTYHSGTSKKKIVTKTKRRTNRRARTRKRTRKRI